MLLFSLLIIIVLYKNNASISFNGLMKKGKGSDGLKCNFLNALPGLFSDRNIEPPGLRPESWVAGSPSAY